MPTTYPPASPGYRWIDGGAVIRYVGTAVTGPGRDAAMWCWDADTGDRVFDLLDQGGAPVAEVPVVDNTFRCQVPYSVAHPLFSVRDGSTRLPGNDWDLLEDARQHVLGDDATLAGYASDPSTQFAQALAAAVTTSNGGKVGKGDLVLNVRDYGAKGDGLADDSAAIQATLNAATPGTVVRIPAGTYRIASEMTTLGGITIDATGATLAAYWPGGGFGDYVMLANGKAGDAPTGYTGNGDLTLIGGVWDARGQANDVSYSSPFAFAHAARVTFQNVTMRNIRRGHAIDLTACRSVKFLSCRFEGYTDTGSPRLTEAIQIDLAASSGTFPRFGAYDSTPCDDVLVQGCTFTSSADCGTWPRAVGSHSARTDRPHTNVRVTGCHMDTYDAGVRAYNWRDFTVTGNTLTGSGVLVLAIDATTPSSETMNAAGVQTNASAPVGPGVIAGNIIKGHAGHGVELNGYAVSGVVSGVTISGNIVHDPTGTGNYQGIRASKVAGVTITGNRVKSAQSQSIEVIASADSVISGNSTNLGGSHGIMLDSSTGCIVADNDVIDAGEHGISLSGSGSANNAVRGNFVSGCSRVTANCVGIRLNSNTNSAVTGNTVRKGTAAPQYGFQVASGCTGTFYLGNDFRLSGATGSLNDVGVGSLTTAGNLT